MQFLCRMGTSHFFALFYRLYFLRVLRAEEEIKTRVTFFHSKIYVLILKTLATSWTIFQTLEKSSLNIALLR
jgi:hypothetical protein